MGSSTPAVAPPPGFVPEDAQPPPPPPGFVPEGDVTSIARQHIAAGMGAEKIPGSPTTNPLTGVGQRFGKAWGGFKSAMTQPYDSKDPMLSNAGKMLGAVGSAANLAVSPVTAPAGELSKQTALSFGASPEASQVLGDFSGDVAGLVAPEAMGAVGDVAKPLLGKAANTVYRSVLNLPKNTPAWKIARTDAAATEEGWPMLGQATKAQRAAGERIGASVENAPDVANVDTSPVHDETLRVAMERPYSEDAAMDVAEKTSDMLDRGASKVTPKRMWATRRAASREIPESKWQGGESAARTEALQGVVSGSGDAMSGIVPADANRTFSNTSELIPGLQAASNQASKDNMNLLSHPIRRAAGGILGGSVGGPGGATVGAALAPALMGPTAKIIAAKGLGKMSNLQIPDAVGRTTGAISALADAFNSPDELRAAYERGDFGPGSAGHDLAASIARNKGWAQ